MKMAPTQNTIPITYESPTTSVPFTMKDADLNTIDMIVVVTQPPELTLTIYGNCPIWALTPPTIPSAGDGVRNNNAGNKHAGKNIWKDLWLRSLDFFLTHLSFHFLPCCVRWLQEDKVDNYLIRINTNNIWRDRNIFDLCLACGVYL